MRVRVDVEDALLHARIRHQLADAGMQVTRGAAPVQVVASPRTAAEQVALVRELLEELPDARIVLIVTEDRPNLHRMLEAGARGVVLARDVDTALAPTIAAVLAGQAVVPSRDSRALDRPVMSHREKEVLELVTFGLTNAQIAARLFLAESTVKSHLNTVYSKLGVRSRSEAAALAVDPSANLGLPLPLLPGAGGGSPATTI
jgi:DNA-binding NarL/FixJ family response regulator